MDRRQLNTFFRTCMLPAQATPACCPGWSIPARWAQASCAHFQTWSGKFRNDASSITEDVCLAGATSLPSCVHSSRECRELQTEVIMARAHVASLLWRSADAFKSLHCFDMASAERSCFGCMTMLTQARRSPCLQTVNTNSLGMHLRSYRKAIRRPAPRGRPVQGHQPTVQTVQVWPWRC